MRITLTDRVSFPVPSQRIITDAGFLQVPGRVARTGIQQYFARELELRNRDPNELINVYRPPEEVFKPESLASYDNADITNDHPKELVNAENFDGTSKGHAISAGRRDGDFVVVDLLIKDGKTINDINCGKCELSAGYTAEYVSKSGVAPCGTPYEFIQTDIKINHIALCDAARAGHQARIFDNKQEVINMPYVTLDNDVTVAVADENTQKLIQLTIDGLRKKLRDAEIEKEAAEGKSDAKDEEIEELKEKASDDSISQRLRDVIAAQNSAKKIAGKSFSIDSVDPVKIKQAALDAAGIKCKKYGSWDKASEAYISAYFDAEEERREAEDEDEAEEKKKSEDSIRGLAKDMGKINTGDAQAERVAARQSFLDTRYNKGSK